MRRRAIGQHEDYDFGGQLPGAYRREHFAADADIYTYRELMIVGYYRPCVAGGGGSMPVQARSPDALAQSPSSPKQMRLFVIVPGRRGFATFRRATATLDYLVELATSSRSTDDDDITDTISILLPISAFTGQGVMAFAFPIGHCSRIGASVAERLSARYRRE